MSADRVAMAPDKPDLRPWTHVISITPFGPDGALDIDGFRRHLRRLRASGIGVYVGGSGSGEGYTLTAAETEALLRAAVEELKGHVPVRAMGVEPRTARQMIEYLRLAKAAGVDAAQIYSLDVGHDTAPSPQEVERYFTDVLNEAPLPVVLSTHFSVGYRLTPALMSKLVETYPQVVGVNVTHPDLGYLAEIIRAVGKRVPVMVGGPMQGLTVLALGGHGYLSSEGNIAPKLCVSIIKAFEAKDAGAMMAAFGTLIELFGVTLANGGTRVAKPALARYGLPGGESRLPRLTVADERLDLVVKAIERLNIPAIEGWNGES